MKKNRDAMQISSPKDAVNLFDIRESQGIVNTANNSKTLEQERQAIDANLIETFSDAELRFGVRAPGGLVLKQRSRTSWDYAPEIRDAIKTLQQQAQRDGRAQRLMSTHLCLIAEAT